MKDFDVKRNERANKDRTFKLNGIEFEYRPAVAPESLLEWSQMIGGEYVERDSNGTIVQAADGQPISSLSEQQALTIYNNTILAFLAPGQEDKWRAARDPNSANPVNLTDLTDLITWLFEETSGRPTGPSSNSSESSSGVSNGQNATVLMPVSPSPPVVPQVSTT